MTKEYYVIAIGDKYLKEKHGYCVYNSLKDAIEGRTTIDLSAAKRYISETKAHSSVKGMMYINKNIWGYQKFTIDYTVKKLTIIYQLI